MKTFANYLRYYNDRHVTGLVKAIETMSHKKFEQGLDIVKESVSLASFTQIYLQQKLDKNDYFFGVALEHKHIYRDLKFMGIVGCASFVFHRYQGAGETLIKGRNLKKSDWNGRKYALPKLH